MSMEETIQDLLNDLQIEPGKTFSTVDAMVSGETKYLKDLRINLKNTLQSANMNPKEAYLIALAIAANDKNQVLTDSFVKLATKNGASQAEIAETFGCASLLAVNNVFYRFRHFMNKDSYKSMPAAIKMNLMINPVLGKELFELISLAVSAVNGCEACVVSHENSLRNLGSSENRIFDSIRLAAVIRGLCAIIR